MIIQRKDLIYFNKWMNEEKINFKNNYKGLLLDIEGVIYEGNKLIEGSIETINKLLANSFKIKYLTNTTTTSRRLIFEKLLQFKLPLNESDIFSPSIATNIFLKKKIFQEYHYLQINFYKKILLIL